MFSQIELHLIRHAVQKELELSEKKLKILDAESDDSIELGNDSMILRNIVEKINDNEKKWMKLKIKKPIEYPKI